jgi:hypothetical protein
LYHLVKGRSEMSIFAPKVWYAGAVAMVLVRDCGLGGGASAKSAKSSKIHVSTQS